MYLLPITFNNINLTLMFIMSSIQNGSNKSRAFVVLYSYVRLTRLKYDKRSNHAISFQGT